MPKGLPLRTGFFRTPVLSEPEQDELLGWAKSLLPGISGSDSQWSIVSDKKNIQVLEDRQKGGMVYSVKSFTTVHASMDDAMQVVNPVSTSDSRSFMQVLLKDYFADTSVLLHSQPNDSDSLSIRWLAVRSNTSLASDQDFCLLNYCGIVNADNVGGDAGKVAGVCLFESIDQVECPSLLDSHRLERGSISKCGLIFRGTDEPGVLEVQFVCSIRQPPKIRSRRKANRQFLLHFADSISKLQDAIITHRLSKKIAKTPNTRWVSDYERQCCYLCMKIFGNMRRKHHCRACGEVICRKCSSHNEVTLPSIGLTTLRICKSCVEGNKKLSDRESFETSSTEVTSDIEENEQALIIPGEAGRVPDQVGLAWLSQLAMRNPEKKKLVESLLTGVDLDDDAFDFPVGDESPPEDIYDALCDLASQALDSDFALVVLVDENRQWFKSRINIEESDVPRDFSFCDFSIENRKPLIVRDTLYDNRFRENPFVTGRLAVRFIVVAPLFTSDGECVGVVSVLDRKPRAQLTQVKTMEKLAQLAMASMQSHRDANGPKILPDGYNAYPALADAPKHEIVPGHGNSAIMESLSGNIETYDHAAAAKYEERQSLENRMHKLLHKSQKTREQLEQHQKNMRSQTAGLNSLSESC